MRRARVEPGALAPAPLAGQTIALDAPTARYLGDVLRMGAGDEVELFDGTGRVVRGSIAELDGALALSVTHDGVTDAGESPLELTLAQAIPKGDRWEWLIEKTTELGVTTILPLQTRRTIVRIKDAKVEAKRARWEKIAAGAARQCERALVPTIERPATLARALDALAGARILVGTTERDAPDLGALLEGARGEHVAILIGPEGGWDPEELAQMDAAGVEGFRCGPRILRSETAGVVFCALAQHRLGDL